MVIFTVTETVHIENELLFTGVVFSDQNNETDLVYGKSSVVPSKGEAYAIEPLVHKQFKHDLLYGSYKSIPTPGEAPTRFVSNRNVDTDLIYGSCGLVYNYC